MTLLERSSPNKALMGPKVHNAEKALKAARRLNRAVHVPILTTGLAPYLFLAGDIKGIALAREVVIAVFNHLPLAGEIALGVLALETIAAFFSDRLLADKRKMVKKYKLLDKDQKSFNDHLSAVV